MFTFKLIVKTFGYYNAFGLNQLLSTKLRGWRDFLRSFLKINKRYPDFAKNAPIVALITSNRERTTRF